MTFSQSLTTDRWTDGPTIKLLFLHKAAKNNYERVCRKTPSTQGLLTKPVGQSNYYDYMGQIGKNTLSHFGRLKKMQLNYGFLPKQV